MPSKTKSKPRPPRDHQPDVVMEFTGDDAFIVFDGVKIAKRGHPGTAQAKTWVSLQPGWRVLDGPNLDSIAIECDGVRVQ